VDEERCQEEMGGAGEVFILENLCAEMCLNDTGGVDHKVCNSK